MTMAMMTMTMTIEMAMTMMTIMMMLTNNCYYADIMIFCIVVDDGNDVDEQ